MDINNNKDETDVSSESCPMVSACIANDPVREITNNLGFRPGPTQTSHCLYSHRSRLKA